MPDDDGGPPLFLIPPGADLEKLRGGPDVTFEGLMPKPGRYRAWTQFRRHDKLHTFAFTFNVVPRPTDARCREWFCLPVASLVTVVILCWPRPLLSHETLTTTVLFDREIVRILDSHCVMCHVENGPSFPLETYEASVAAEAEDQRRGHRPPHAAMGRVPGLRAVRERERLTLRESQFIVSWVEGLGPRNAAPCSRTPRTPSTPKPQTVRALEPTSMPGSSASPALTRALEPMTIAPRQPNDVRRTVVDLGLTAERRVSAIEYMPGDRRVVRAAFFTIQETGQWVGSWTPWYGFTKLPAGAAFRLPAGTHLAAEIHYQHLNQTVVDQGTVGLIFAGTPSGGGAGGHRARRERRRAARRHGEALSCPDGAGAGHCPSGDAPRGRTGR